MLCGDGGCGVGSGTLYVNCKHYYAYAWKFDYDWNVQSVLALLNKQNVSISSTKSYTQWLTNIIISLVSILFRIQKAKKNMYIDGSTECNSFCEWIWGWNRKKHAKWHDSEKMTFHLINDDTMTMECWKTTEYRIRR